MRKPRLLKIAEIRGIKINIHVSLAFLALYVLFLTAVRFPIVAREADVDLSLLSLGPVAWGLILAVSLCISVVLHELGHAFTAQALGVKVRSITLMMLGGVSQMDRMPERKYAELKLSIMGPLVSFALAAIFLVIHSRTSSPDLAFYSYWIGSVNLALGIFNLLPAFPLDGGRALRSVLAARQGMVRATQVSVRVSRGFAWALGILGVIGFNVLLILIAFFIHSAAQTELFFLLTKGLLKGLTAGEVALRTPTVQSSDPLLHAVDLMMDARTTVLPVDRSRDLRLAGTDAGGAVVSLSAIRRVPRTFWQTTLVRDVMDETQKILNGADSVADTLPELAGAPMQALPVAENGQIIGIVRYQDISDILEFRSLDEQAA